MKKGIKSKKFKRMMHKAAVLAVTAIAFVMVLIMPIMFAFYEARMIYAILWAFGAAWCGCFIIANEKRCAEW